jgi:DNA (cytosine-5)-methyltransferase 1
MTLPAGKLRILDLFSGIGGFSLGLERTGGFETVAFCEIEPFPRRVLAKHWPKVPRYDDVRTLTAERLASDGICIDVICGGFPCQDITRANMRTDWTGLDGERSGLWSEFARLIGELRPQYVVVENSSDLLGRGLSRILGDLASIGYDAEWHCIPAVAVGACHLRDRVWVVAYPNSQRLEGEHRHRESAWNFGRGRDGAPWRILHSVDAKDWVPEPRVCRVAHGVPARMDRLHSLGNAVVPQIPQMIGEAILSSMSIMP